MPTMQDLKVDLKANPKQATRCDAAKQLEPLDCSATQTKKCGAHYKQLAFVLPFLSVYMMYSCSGDASPCATAVALTAGTLAGAVSFGLYRAIKLARHSSKC